MSSRVEELKAELLQFHKSILSRMELYFRGGKKLAHLLCLYEKIGEPLVGRNWGLDGKKKFEGMQLDI